MDEITVLYQDDCLTVCVKPAGMPSQADPSGARDLLDALEEQTKTRHYLIHRLDRAVGGVMVFARTKASAAALSAAVASHDGFEKTYLAILGGVCDGSGTLTDYLYHDKRLRKAFVVSRARQGVREAVLHYTRLATGDYGGNPVSLVRVQLLTGRFHQIRVQFASRGLSLVGDGKYGSRIKAPLALWASEVSFTHPATGRKMTFATLPPPCLPWSRFPDLPELSAPSASPV